MSRTLTLLAAVSLVTFIDCRRTDPSRVATDSAAPCLSYESDLVTIRGQLVRLTFPGPPNFEDTLHGDRPETGFYLQVDPPLCVRGGRASADEARANVDRVQLILDSAGYAALRPLIGTSVGLRGSLVASGSGHHHAPVLLDVAKPVTAVR